MQSFYPSATQHIIPFHFQVGRPSGNVNTIILHITEGFTAAGAIATFEQSVSPNRVSAHLVIDRDGSIFQCVGFNDIAWHASQCNATSIGIEHVALSAPGALSLSQRTGNNYVAELVTDEQYAASVKVIQWLCSQLELPIDRNHIRTHNEASPRDGHVLCCTGALDPDKVVQMALIQ